MKTLHTEHDVLDWMLAMTGDSGMLVYAPPSAFQLAKSLGREMRSNGYMTVDQIDGEWILADSFHGPDHYLGEPGAYSQETGMLVLELAIWAVRRKSGFRLTHVRLFRIILGLGNFDGVSLDLSSNQYARVILDPNKSQEYGVAFSVEFPRRRARDLFFAG